MKVHSIMNSKATGRVSSPSAIMTPPGQKPVEANMLPVVVHLLLVLALGLAIPGFLSRWFEQATVLITGASPL